MTNKKPKMLVLTSVSILILFLPSCIEKKQENFDTEKIYNDQWEKGKVFFYNNCGPCHVPRLKDKIFESFNSQKRGKSEEKRLAHLKGVLFDSNHINKNIGVEKLNLKELKQLLVFLETPQKRTVD